MPGVRRGRSPVGSARRSDRRRPNARVWAFLACGLLIVGLITVFAVRGARILGLRHQLEDAHQGILEAEAARSGLQAQLDRRDHADAIEDAARRLLGWVKPGEVRVIFVDPEGGSAE